MRCEETPVGKGADGPKSREGGQSTWEQRKWIRSEWKLDVRTRNKDRRSEEARPRKKGEERVGGGGSRRRRERDDDKVAEKAAQDEGRGGV